MTDYKEFTYSSDLARLDDLYRELEKLFAKWRVPTAAVDDLMLCISEAATNAIVHAHGGDSSKQIHLRVELDNKVVTVDVDDYGQGDGLTAIQEFQSSGDLYAESGRGLALMRRLADDFLFFSREDGGLTVRIVKIFADERKQAEHSGRK
jgi:serine/threonine-protein kinase RsbW